MAEPNKLDWTASMQQTFEYYIVDPGTWMDRKRVKSILSSSISRDYEADTLGSATIETTEMLGTESEDGNEILGECYIRIYLIAIQNGFRYKIPMGTYLIQTPTKKFDGKISSYTLDAYTPLIELKENPPPLGYSIMKNSNVMDSAYYLIREHARAPVTKTTDETNLYFDFVADTEDTWLTFLMDLLAQAKYSFYLDEMGRILFEKKQETAALQPKFTYGDNNSSILYPETTLEKDLYGVPNVVEVVYSQGGMYYETRKVNDDPNSPTSTVKRGREITKRVTNPDLGGEPTKHQLDRYAEQLLQELSTVEYTISYSHGYNDVQIGDCVRLDYRKAGLRGVKARVISQNIQCKPGCQVTEKAVFTKKLWG